MLYRRNILMIDFIGIPLSAYLCHQQKILAVERFVDLVLGDDMEFYARQDIRVMQGHLFRVRFTDRYQVIRIYGYYVLIIVSILLAMLPLFFNNPTFVDPERGIESTLGVFHLSIGYYLWIGSFLTLLLGEIVLFFQK